MALNYGKGMELHAGQQILFVLDFRGYGRFNSSFAMDSAGNRRVARVFRVIKEVNSGWRFWFLARRRIYL